MKKEWIYDNSGSEEKSLIKRLLISRGITTDEDIKDFLNPLEMELTSPYAFCDMKKAIERLSKAIENRENIVIYGDFDADGITSTSILYKTLKHIGAEVHHFIPDRETQGHGFDTKALVKIMTTIKPKVIISVDCGISDVEAIKFINSFKTIDVIITDHHEAPEVLPEAFAIINPKAPYALDEKLTSKQIEYLTYLAGCGVAFKVAQALLTEYSKTDFIYEILPFVAVGSIADVVPLLGENRYFAAKGLELISQGKHYGLTKLIESAGYDITKGVTTENIGFGVAPRINASSRMDTVDSAWKVLTSDNKQEIEVAIATLNELNAVRQTKCSEVFEQADAMVQKEGNKNPAIVLAHEDWHGGVIGIVAAKLVEKYYKPVFLMVHKKETNEYGCSARSIEGVPLYDVIAENAELFKGFGGHKMAAGLSFDGDEETFEQVKKALNESVKNYTQGQDLKPHIKIDLKLQPEDITINLVEEISKLEPFGASNPSPIFSIENLKVKQKRLMGSDNSHLRLIMGKDAYEFTSVWWSKGDIPLSAGDSADIAFHPQINEYNGNISVQLVIDDIHSEVLDNEQETSSQCKYKIYDNRTKTGILTNVNDYLKTTKLNIKVFAESKYILDTIKSYPQIASKTFTRNNIPKCDVVMFFDYPSDKKMLDYILEKSEPKGLHFMNYEPKFFDEQGLVQTFNGMVKYASHANGGKLELIRCASFLGKSIEVVEKLLELFKECGIIEIKDKNNDFYTIEYINGDLSQVKDHPKFTQIYNLSEECEMFQHSMMEDDLVSIVSQF
ncbi:single-stranded-DNA-specific exonuclease RecJ [bacterium]|nr:single-stranded-DNA-specific exonuclease RecJ [bacterium]